MADRNDAVTMSLAEAKILVMRGMAGQSPRINPTNNHWEVYDNESGSWKDTGVDASGNIDITGDNQLVFLNYDGDTTLITNAETGESITAAQIGALTTQGKMSFLYVDTDSPEWLAFNGWFPNSGEAVFDNDRLHAVVTTNLQTLVTTGLVTVKPMLPSVTTEDAGKVLKVSNTGVWGVGSDNSGDSGLPNWSGAADGDVLKILEAEGGRGPFWARDAGEWIYLRLRYSDGAYGFADPEITAEYLIANWNHICLMIGNSDRCYLPSIADTYGGVRLYAYYVGETASRIEGFVVEAKISDGSIFVTYVNKPSDELPSVSVANAGQVLMVDSNGVWSRKELPKQVQYLKHYTRAYSDGNVSIAENTIRIEGPNGETDITGEAIANMVLDGVCPIIMDALTEYDYNPEFYHLASMMRDSQVVFVNAGNGYDGRVNILAIPWESAIATHNSHPNWLPDVTAADAGKALVVNSNGYWGADYNGVFEIPVTQSNGTYSTNVSAADIIAHRKNLIASSTGIVMTCDGFTFSGLDIMTFYFSARQIDYTSHTEYIHSMTIVASTLNGADTVTITAENYSIELTHD